MEKEIAETSGMPVETNKQITLKKKKNNNKKKENAKKQRKGRKERKKKDISCGNKVVNKCLESKRTL